MPLSVVLATYNEEATLARCLSSVGGLADEVVIADGGSTDKTVEIARQFGARIIQTSNPPIFHINKQKAVDRAKASWILQLDADEAVSEALAQEIWAVIRMSDRQREELSKTRVDPLFIRHQKLVEKRDGPIGTGSGPIVAYFVARRNFFLGHPLRYAGAYPDGVIRLFQNGKAHFPSKSVHEQLAVDGRVGWLSQDLLHYSNPTLATYLAGADKYTNLLAQTIAESNVSIVMNLASYVVIRPVGTFLSLYVRHKGFLDGIYGFLFCFFSSLHFPLAYGKYVSNGFFKKRR